MVALDPQKLSELRQRHDLFLADEDAGCECDFRDAMRAFRAPHAILPAPRGIKGKAIIVLPRRSPRSRKVAGIFRENGAVDVGAHLSGLCELQMVNWVGLPLPWRFAHSERSARARELGGMTGLSGSV